jgi:hypothetical protein
MTLKTMNNTVKIRMTTIVNGDMGFSFPSIPYRYTLAGCLKFALYDKTRIVLNRCLQNQNKKKKARLSYGSELFRFAPSQRGGRLIISKSHRGEHLIV